MPFLREENIDVPKKDILSWYFDEPQYNLNEPVYIDAVQPSRYYTGKQARSAIRKLVAGLRAAGFKKGDVVCIHSFNDVHYPILVNGIVAAGGIFSGTNPSYTAYELAHAVRTARISWFIVEPELLPNILEATAQQKDHFPKDHIFVFDHEGNSGKVPSGLRSWRWLCEQGEDDWVRFDGENASKETQCARLFSSGTTGLPKAAVFNHWNFKAQHVQMSEGKPVPYEIRRLIPLPLFHVATVPNVHFSPLRNGTRTFILRRFDLQKYLEAIEYHKITDIWAVPPMTLAILNTDLTKKYSMKSIKSAFSGGAPLDKEPQARVQALLSPEGRFCQLWAMTELTCVAIINKWPEYDVSGSVGIALPGLDFKLVDDEDNDITSDGVVGEMCVRGESVISGYLDDAKANASWDSDGFFHTGDIMYRDGTSKKWFIVDRKKELIKVRGFQVAPAELEGVLISHPLILDAAVIGVKAETKAMEATEAPRAYIIKKPSVAGSEELDEQAVRRYMEKRLAGYKKLEGGVVFVEEIPKNASGKILKRILRERAAGEMKAKL